MNDNRTALAAAVAGGYLLGRTRKAGLALAVGSYLAGRRLGLSPGRVLSQGLGRLQQAPQLQELTEQVRGELLTAGRAAFTAAANRRLTGLADTLRDRTDALTGASREGDEEDYDDTEYDDDHYYDDDSDGYGYEDEDGHPQEEDGYPEEEDEAEEEGDEPVPAPPREAARKAADKPAGNAPPRKAAPGRMAKKAPAKRAPAKKTAAPAKRTTGRPGAEGRG
ncbi:hypothetical protein GCM10010377_41400 [Streptomyces viridiviolaceus]|uniref:Histone protein n=1 Tax=Streptomyces viridiviolaceus TaxID=68282 RepID=A0ABW2E535_9ACTN|nr:hypothetical protein [Streptomyces viridiviolaceus]GHB46249.1 hypothetical protein GCM10010377_41400 [Streptomyces viridiviolaceus]